MRGARIVFIATILKASHSALAASIAGLALLGAVCLFKRYGTAAKAIMTSLVMGEGMMLFGLAGEFDMGNNYSRAITIWGPSQARCST